VGTVLREVGGHDGRADVSCTRGDPPPVRHLCLRPEVAQLENDAAVVLLREIA